MKFYKDATGFWLNGELTPQGFHTLQVDTDNATISRFRDNYTIYNGLISGLLKENGTGYSSKADLLSAVGDFFVKAPTGGGGVEIVNDLASGGTTKALSAEQGKELQNTKAAIPISLTYTELKTLVDTSSLVVGQRYIINDYQTVHEQPNTGEVTFDFENYQYITQPNVIYTAPVEPLLVTALTTSKLANECQSLEFPQDIIYYNIENDQAVVPGCAKGYIYRRIDTELNNDIDMDFRKAKIRAYLVNGSYRVCYWLIDPFGTFDGSAFFGCDFNLNNYNLTVNYKAVDFNSINKIDTIIFKDATNYESQHIRNNKFYGNSTNLIGNRNSLFVGNYFNSNIIGDNFKNNTIGYKFNSNTIGNNFYNNNIGDNFYSNTIGDNFSYNTIGNNFYSNTIVGYFNSNTIGYQFNSNTIGNNFYNNTIGNNFYSNTIRNGFNSNTIGNTFISNTIGIYFYSNTIGDNFSYNTIEKYFGNNAIGDNFYSNTIGNSFISNTIGNYFNSNTIENYFDSNTIGNGFNVNTIRNDFNNNTIGNGFNVNTIRNDFNNNTIGSDFNNNTIGNYFNYNTIGNYFNYNTIGNYFNNNGGVDFTIVTATLVYQSFNKELFTNQDYEQYLSYYDGDNVLQIISATA